MIKLDLITGFLGSGKTTFIKKYAQHLMDSKLNIGILENDYGAVNVDMMLLSHLRGDYCELETVAGACDKDCHKRRFKTKLIAMGMLGYDRVLIEPSGLFDVDEFFDTVREEPVDRWYEIGNVFAVVEGNLQTDLSKESQFLLASQIANAGKVIISKSQECSDKEIESTIDYINSILKTHNCKEKSENDFFIKDWNNLSDKDFNSLINSGYTIEDYVKIDTKNSYSTVYFTNLSVNKDNIKDITERLFSHKECGNIFRIKGFFKNDKWYQLNATKSKITIEEINLGQEIIIIIGENLNEEKIKSYF